MMGVTEDILNWGPFGSVQMHFQVPKSGHDDEMLFRKKNNYDDNNMATRSRKLQISFAQLLTHTLSSSMSSLEAKFSI